MDQHNDWTPCLCLHTAKPTRVAIDELQLQDLQNMEAVRSKVNSP